MSDARLAALAREAGLDVKWRDASGKKHKVANETLKSVLRALELPAETRGDIDDSRARLRRQAREASPLIVASAGETFRLPSTRHVELVLESGARKSLKPGMAKRGFSNFRAPRDPGYHTLAFNGQICRLAVAPAHCLLPEEVVANRRLCGLSAQIYALQGGTSGAFGDFSALGSLAIRAGGAGFDAIMTSPVHAQFGADPARFRPYSPSTRLFLNPLFADATLAGGPQGKPARNALIDWAREAAQKHQILRETFRRYRSRSSDGHFENFCRAGGARLLAHALFEALDHGFRARGICDWKSWPAEFASPVAPGIRAYAHARPEEIEYQLFLQWLCETSAAAAQKAARRSMAIGIIADIAVGVDPGGSHAWSAPHELLQGLHVGAPPDVFNPRGQDWGLTTVSPRALALSGFAPFLATLRAGMRNAGGVRIDHALGLRRLWLVTEGASPADGVYLRYPQRELLRLVALESRRQRAIVIGEDLGTVPQGFRQALASAGILGMQVLWFERDRAGRFTAPARWRRTAVATSTTHDLPTISGWWSERDIDWQESLRKGGGEEARIARAGDRRSLWAALQRAKCASGPPPPRRASNSVVEAALRYIGRTRPTLAFAPLEDIVGDDEQPNLPGTTDEHPNWRRRLATADPFGTNASGARAAAFVKSRRAR